MKRSAALGFATATLLCSGVTQAASPSVTVAYQPMISTGLATKQPFEAWFVLDKSSDPSVAGYGVPAGATMRLTFPGQFTPLPDAYLEGALLHGWPQGGISAPFSVTQDDADPRTVVVRIDEEISPAPPERPGLKAVHVRTGEINPSSPGDYPIKIQFVDAGPLEGVTTAIAHITEKPVPNVAAYNQLHQSKDEDWQRVETGMEAPLPIDFLVTLPDEPRSSITLTHASGYSLSILSDGKPIGSITTKGVPIVLSSQNFGPGFARLGIVEVHARAGETPGAAQIVASLNGGTQYVINLNVERTK